MNRTIERKEPSCAPISFRKPRANTRCAAAAHRPPNHPSKRRGRRACRPAPADGDDERKPHDRQRPRHTGPPERPGSIRALRRERGRVTACERGYSSENFLGDLPRVARATGSWRICAPWLEARIRYRRSSCSTFAQGSGTDFSQRSTRERSSTTQSPPGVDGSNRTTQAEPGTISPTNDGAAYPTSSAALYKSGATISTASTPRNSKRARDAPHVSRG